MSEYDLERFVKAQAVMFERALSEIRAGRKRSHWMWYIFPQLKKLGHSANAVYYGISDVDEARAYIQNDLLRENLMEISRALLELESSDPVSILGDVDSLKLLSCMTLFEIAAPDIPEFAAVIEKFYGGKRDEMTVKLE